MVAVCEHTGRTNIGDCGAGKAVVWLQKLVCKEECAQACGKPLHGYVKYNKLAILKYMRIKNPLTLLVTCSLLIIVGAGGYLYVAQPQVEPEPVKNEVIVKPKPAEQTREQKIAELLKLTNEKRAEVNAAPLALDEALNKSAQKKAEQMLAENNYSHVDSAGVHGYIYIGQFTDKCTVGSENLSATNWPPATIRLNMISTKGHREAMLNTRYELVGFGIAGNYTVQHFCDIN
jgi:hypothetical protein